jgi:UPF0716 protein FxsA
MPLLLILIYPLAEIAAFIVIGRAIGLFPTLALVIASSALGAVMLRDAGAMTMLKLERRPANPSIILAEGGARMLAGLLLLVPGFLTDFAALFLLVPRFRGPLTKRFGGTAHGGVPRPEPAPDVIEGDFRRLDDPR